MYKNLVNHGKNYQPALVIAGFLNHQLINSHVYLIVHVCTLPKFNIEPENGTLE